jgi:phosphoglycerate dehydrogenase-like enzyme
MHGSLVQSVLSLAIEIAHCVGTFSSCQLNSAEVVVSRVMAYRIFADLAASDKALQLLQEGTRHHQLLFPSKPATSCLHQGDTDPLMSTAEIIVGQPNPAAIADVPHLKWIQISTSSITRYDTHEFRDLIQQRAIPVCNSASVYREACAEHTLAFMLAQSRLLPRSLGTRAAGGTLEWDHLRDDSIPLQGQTVLIVGYGTIGQRLAELLVPFSMQVVAHRRQARDDEQLPVVTLSELPRALSSADHVVNILPDSAETRHFFNAERFALMKSTSVFYNIGRGTTVDQEALAGALRSKHIKAAWLDVTDPEPLPAGHALLTLTNCYITPHVAGGHQNESMTFVRHFLANLARFEQGVPLCDRVM